MYYTLCSTAVAMPEMKPEKAPIVVADSLCVWSDSGSTWEPACGMVCGLASLSTISAGRKCVCLFMYVYTYVRVHAYNMDALSASSASVCTSPVSTSSLPSLSSSVLVASSRGDGRPRASSTVVIAAVT